MAGDWIKMRLDLAEDPAVMQMAEALGMPEACVVGYLHTVWSWASRQCHDGSVTGVTPEALGRVLNCASVPALMVQVGWLETDENGWVRFPKWERHLSQSAKKRALATERARHARVTKTSRTQRDKNATREEKRREEQEPPISPPRGDDPKGPEYSPRFEDWWALWPSGRKTGKRKAFRAWKQVTRYDIEPDALIERTREFCKSPKALGRFCPYPSTWLNRGSWTDDPEAWQDGGEEPTREQSRREIEDEEHARAAAERERTRAERLAHIAQKQKRDGTGLPEDWKAKIVEGNGDATSSND